MKAATVNTEVRNFFFGFSGFFDRREFIVTQHPLERTVCDFWRMIWEQDSRLIVTLSSIDSQECRPFWPAIIGETLSLETNKRDQQMRLTLLEEVDTLARRAIRLNLELVSIGLSSHLGPLGKYVHIVVFYGPTASTYSLSLWNSICLFCLLHLCLYLMSSIYTKRKHSTTFEVVSVLFWYSTEEEEKIFSDHLRVSCIVYSVFYVLCGLKSFSSSRYWQSSYVQGLHLPFNFLGESARSLDFPQSQLASTVLTTFYSFWPRQSGRWRTSGSWWRTCCHCGQVRFMIRIFARKLKIQTESTSPMGSKLCPRVNKVLQHHTVVTADRF